MFIDSLVSSHDYPSPHQNRPGRGWIIDKLILSLIEKQQQATHAKQHSNKVVLSVSIS